MDVTATRRQPPSHRSQCNGFYCLLWHIGRATTAWSRCRRGVSAVEFALIAPILGFALLASTDLGLAVSERMAIHHVLRASAQHAMSDPGEAAVLDVMRSAAEANFTIDDGTASSTAPLSLSAIRYAVCPEDLSFAVPPSTVCAGSKPTFIYYRLFARKTFTGWMMPAITFDRAVQVQIR